jgi:hypothetical protein
VLLVFAGVCTIAQEQQVLCRGIGAKAARFERCAFVLQSVLFMFYTFTTLFESKQGIALALQPTAFWGSEVGLACPPAGLSVVLWRVESFCSESFVNVVRRER